jgi:hypothetical protein
MDNTNRETNSHSNMDKRTRASTTMSSPQSILVLGAGELGSQVLKSLTQHPERGNVQIAILLRPSTIASSDPTKQAEIQSYKRVNISLIPGDVATDTTTHLTSLFGQFDTIISCTGMTLPRGTQLKLSRAVLEAGVKRYFPWQFGLDYDAIGRASSQDLFDEQLDVRDILRAQENTEWVVVSTGVFMSFLFEPAFGVVDLKAGRVQVLGDWRNELAVTTVEDIGRVVAEIALVEVEERGVVYVAGDMVSMRRLADVVEMVLGRSVERSMKTVEQLKRDLAQDPGDMMKKYRAVFAAGVGVSWDREQTFNVRNDMKTVSVEEWARDNLGASKF